MNLTLDKSNTLNCKVPITVFSLIALVCTTLSCITYFVTYVSEYVDGEWVYEYIIGFPDLFRTLYLLVDIIPCVLLVIYILFHKKFKAKIFMSIIFGIFVFSALLVIVKGIVEQFHYDEISYIIYSLQIITFSLATISVLKGFFKKLFPVIALCFGLVTQIYYSFDFFKYIHFYIEDSLFIYLFTKAMGIIGFISLFVALLLFVFNNNLPSILKISNKKEKMMPEQALKLLKDKLDLGMISEEEYQIQRADIISKI